MTDSMVLALPEPEPWDPSGYTKSVHLGYPIGHSHIWI